MKTRFHVKLLSTALLSLWLTSGCADQSAKSEAAASKASPETTAAIANANDAIAIAKSNDWIWRDTEKFLGQAKAAADAGDNAKAIKLADKARFEAESAVKQYNLETTHQRGLRR
ncbi:MAG: SoxXA-binding protein [Pseudomonadota bacterium]